MSSGSWAEAEQAARRAGTRVESGWAEPERAAAHEPNQDGPSQAKPGQVVGDVGGASNATTHEEWSKACLIAYDKPHIRAVLKESMLGSYYSEISATKSMLSDKWM